MKNETIKRISIKDYLASQGIFPAKEHPTYAMYKSPFRDERTPSFKVDYQANIWCDFGTGEGGSIIDLVMKINKCNFIQAVEFLEKQENRNIKTYQHTYFSENENKSADTSLKITAIKPLENPKLLTFLQSRKIDINIAKTIARKSTTKLADETILRLDFPTMQAVLRCEIKLSKAASRPIKSLHLRKTPTPLISLKVFSII